MYKIKLRCDNKARCELYNPVLKLRETDTKKMKAGDGVTSYRTFWVEVMMNINFFFHFFFVII